MMRNAFALLVASVLTRVAAAAHAAPAADSPPRPNILIILANDLGNSDLGCFGGDVQTPTGPPPGGAETRPSPSRS